MPDLGPHPPARRVARRNAIGRRFFLESCLGAMTGAIAAQSSPALAQTVAASSVNFFPGFRRQTVQTSGTTINVLVGGDGPPVLLLHGYPQTHVEWRKIAPELARTMRSSFLISAVTATAASRQMDIIISTIQSVPWLWTKSK